MTCSHCGDLIVEDRFLDWMARWRCLKHGHVQDTNSMQHLLAKKALSSQGAEPEYLDEEVHLNV